MRRILLACAASLVLYVTAFACLLDRPLTLGMLQARIEANLARGAAIAGPKLVILAGSNGPYSHRCETMEPIISRPCINAGVAVGVGLDYLFVRWEPLLHPGDVVYLPLEEAQYTRSRSAAELGPDAAIMLRHDRATLRTMPPSSTRPCRCRHGAPVPCGCSPTGRGGASSAPSAAAPRPSR